MQTARHLEFAEKKSKYAPESGMLSKTTNNGQEAVGFYQVMALITLGRVQAVGRQPAVIHAKSKEGAQALVPAVGGACSAQRRAVSGMQTWLHSKRGRRCCRLQE